MRNLCGRRVKANSSTSSFLHDRLNSKRFQSLNHFSFHSSCEISHTKIKSLQLLGREEKTEKLTLSQWVFLSANINRWRITSLFVILFRCFSPFACQKIFFLWNVINECDTVEAEKQLVDVANPSVLILFPRGLMKQARDGLRRYAFEASTWS